MLWLQPGIILGLILGVPGLERNSALYTLKLQKCDVDF